MASLLARFGFRARTWGSRTVHAARPDGTPFGGLVTACREATDVARSLDINTLITCDACRTVLNLKES